MKIAYLNTYSNGSTGRIIDSLMEICRKHAIESISIYARGPLKEVGSSYRQQCKVEFYLDAFFTRLLDGHGLGNVFNTYKIIRKLKAFNPDIIHLHNLHGYWINYVILFKYLKKNNIKIVWTFHDCWHFTGHCTHFDYVKCDKWKTCCHHCIQFKEFPASYCDFSRRNYRLKKKSFTSVKDMIIVTPSEWLNEIVRQSFLKGYDMEVINNGIDTEIFKPSANSEKRKGILGKGFKAIVLGVAASWNERKGLCYIQDVAQVKKDWFFVIIGSLNEKRIKRLDNIIYIDRTEDIIELRDWYSTADVLAQPTLEDTYPTINLESIACGTPVVTFPTGGSEEIIRKSGFGVVTEKCTSESLLEGLNIIINEKSLRLNPEFELNSDMNFVRYVDVYKRIAATTSI